MKASEFAVPIFLMISGYFACKIKENIPSKLWRRAKHILLISVMSFMFYFLFTMMRKMGSNDLNSWILNFLCIKCWIKIILLGNWDIVGAGHLWYLTALFISYLILIVIEMKHCMPMFYRILPLIFILRTLVYVVTLTNDLSWHIRGNFLVDAMPWLLMGHYLGYNTHFLKILSNRCIVLTTFLGLIYGITFELISFTLDLSEIGITVYSLGIFIMALRNKKSICYSIEMLGEKYSLYVYIFHIAVMGIISKVILVLGLDDNEMILWLNPIIVVLITIIVSIVWNTLYQILFRKYKLNKY